MTIHDLESVRLPARLWFFRLMKTGGIAGVSLMYDLPDVHSFGVDHFTIERFVDCTLHTLDLGVTGKWHGQCLWLLLRNDVYNTEFPTKVARVRAGILQMRKEMLSYYKAILKRRK